MYLVINKCVTAVILSNSSGHYLRNRSTSDIGVLGYIGIVQHKEHSPEVSHIPPGTPCIAFPTPQNRDIVRGGGGNRSAIRRDGDVEHCFSHLFFPVFP